MSVELRDGEVLYSDGEHTLRLDVVRDGGVTPFIVKGPSPRDWDEQVPWAAGRRKEVMLRVAEEIGRQIGTPIFTWGDDDTTLEFMLAAPANRAAGHWLLLLLAVFFVVETILFFAKALQEGRASLHAGSGWLILTIGTFLTGVAALQGFVRKVQAAFAELVGLLLIQPGISFLSHLADPKLKGASGSGLASTIAGVLLLGYVFVANRTNRME